MNDASLPPGDPLAPATLYYHQNCPDGATAAWIVQQHCERAGAAVRFVPLRPNHMADLSAALGAHVWMLDVCVPPHDLDELHALALSVRVLDHHKTSLECAEGRDWVLVDPMRCAAMLAWQAIHGAAEPPTLVRYVQDMDLWRNELPETQAVQRLLRTLTRPEQVPAMVRALDDEFDATVGRLGARVEADRVRLRDYLGKTITARLAGTQVRAVCLAPGDAPLGSDIANAIAEKFGGIAVAWRRDSRSYRYSLRSVPEVGPDVTPLARQFGGGGHTHAAGCIASRQILQFAGKGDPERPR